jgi:hypothetical protein
MPTTAGFQLVAGRIPGERIATTTRTSSTAGFTTTETVSDTVTAPLVSGRTYKVTAWVLCRTNTANDSMNVRIREDNLTGTEMQAARIYLPIITTTFVAPLEALYTAVSTGDKDFVVTGVRASGTGTLLLAAAATQPVYLYVDYISG